MAVIEEFVQSVADMGNYPPGASGVKDDSSSGAGVRESFRLRPDGSPYKKGPVWSGWYYGCRTPVDYLWGWWNHSYARKLAQEICSLPLRIAETLRRPCHYRYCLPLAPCNLPARSFSERCSVDIESLRKEYPWVGDLDLQMAARAYQLGCLFAASTLCRQSS